MIVDRIKEDLKISLKSGDAFRVGVLRMLLSEIHNKEKEKRPNSGEEILNDGEAIVVLERERKKRGDSADLFRRGGRSDLAEKEEAEIKVIESYLPEQAKEEEVSDIVDKAIARVGGDFGAVMREVMKELRGRMDGKVVGEIVKRKLG